MKHVILAGSVAACALIGLVAPLLAAEAPTTPATVHATSHARNVARVKPAKKCLSDLRAFDHQMEKDGRWLGGSGYGYGYPMGEAGYALYPSGGLAGTPATGYLNARPGYDVRTLVASANILARRGQQDACETVLGTTRDIYKVYLADMKSGDMPIADMPGWRNQLLAAAVPVTDKNMIIRSDELLGSPVRNLKDVALGSVDDLVMDPKTGQIAYVVIARGGLFGIDEKYVPVPWGDFKITQNVNLLVLDTTKGALDAAPQVGDDQFALPGQFKQQSQKVDAYWKLHLSSEGTLPPKG